MKYTQLQANARTNVHVSPRNAESIPTAVRCSQSHHSPLPAVRIVATVVIKADSAMALAA